MTTDKILNLSEVTNQYIVDRLELYARLLELHGQDAKAKAYYAAAFRLAKRQEPIRTLSRQELIGLAGVGKQLADKIIEIIQKGTFEQLQQLLEQTPVGLLELFEVKGLGVKKVRRLWQELGITDLQALEQACLDNRVASLSGMGEKSQQSILDSIATIRRNRFRYLWWQLKPVADELLQLLLADCKCEVDYVGAMSRYEPVLECVELLAISDQPAEVHTWLNRQSILQSKANASGVFCWRGVHQRLNVPVHVHIALPEHAAQQRLLLTASEAHLSYHHEGKTLLQVLSEYPYAHSEQQIYTQAGLPFVPAFMRNGLYEWDWTQHYQLDELVEPASVRGVLHMHTTYSDGQNSIAEMAAAAKKLGYSYVGITDHSKSAFYANGLDERRLQQQWQEIELLNQQLDGIRILKGIEVDILADGSLDYDDDILMRFDFVIASIHTALSMGKQKAMQRLLAAIAHPNVHILGHPTGRILLAREGYPLDMEALIEACARHQVAIEINGSPSRSDLDWQWVWRAMQAGVYLVITPDAHSVQELAYMEWGMKLAQKAGLVKHYCLNCLDADALLDFFRQKGKC